MDCYKRHIRLKDIINSLDISLKSYGIENINPIDLVGCFYTEGNDDDYEEYEYHPIQYECNTGWVYDEIPYEFKYDFTPNHFECMEFPEDELYPKDTPLVEIQKDYCVDFLDLAPKAVNALKALEEIKESNPELFI